MESKLKLPRYRFLGENAFELKKKLEDFEIESVIFDGVTSEPTDIMVEEGCILYQAIAIAWILRHPAKMQVIAGTMSPQHLTEMSDACKVYLTHEEWYRLYLASGKFLP